MRFFNFVEEDDSIRASTHSLCEDTSLIVSNIPRGGSDEPTHAVLLHIFGAVNSDNVLFRTEQFIRKGFGCLSLPDACPRQVDTEESIYIYVHRKSSPADVQGTGRKV